MVAPRSPAPLSPAVQAAAFIVSGPRPCPPSPPPYSMAFSSGLRSPLRGQIAVCWWVRDNPAPRARARALVAALATCGTVQSIFQNRPRHTKNKKNTKTYNEVTFYFLPAPEDFYRCFPKGLRTITWLKSLQLSIFIQKLQFSCHLHHH